MNKLGAAAILWLAAMTSTAGCGGKAAPAPAAADPATTPITKNLTSPGAEPLTDLEGLRTQACECRDQACVHDVQLAFANFMEKHADTLGTEREADEAGRIAEEMTECLADVPAPPLADERLGECDAYIAAVERFIQCDKVPQASRDATRQGLDGMKAAWDDTDGMPPEARRAANDSCRQATDALVEGANAMGCVM